MRSLATAIIAILYISYLPISGKESSPSPRRSQQRADDSNQSNNKRKRQNTPALQASPVHAPVESRNDQEKGSDITGSAKQQPIQIQIPPITVNPVEVQKDRTDYFYVIGYLFLSLLLVFVAGYQAVMLKRTLSATTIAADAARRSAETANRSIEAAIQISRTDQRAWVGIKTITLKTLKVGHPVEVVTCITNTGKTPAIRVVTHIVSYMLRRND